MSYGLQAWDANGREIFSSVTDFTMFYIYSDVVRAATVDRVNGRVISFPELAGRQIIAFMQSPYNNGSTSGWAVLSCRVTYPGQVPTVTIFVDNPQATLPICDGWLTVMLTGGGV